MKVTKVDVELAAPEVRSYLASVELVIDNVLTIRDVRVKSFYNEEAGGRELRIHWPSRKHRVDDSWYNIVTVSGQKLWEEIKNKVLDAYNEALVNAAKRKEEVG